MNRDVESKGARYTSTRLRCDAMLVPVPQPGRPCECLSFEEDWNQPTTTNMENDEDRLVCDFRTPKFIDIDVSSELSFPMKLDSWVQRLKQELTCIFDFVDRVPTAPTATETLALHDCPASVARVLLRINRQRLASFAS